MKTFSKILSAVLNALNYIVGILIVLVLVIKADLIPILRIDGYTTLQQVFVSILAFQLVIALAQGAVSAVAKDYGDSRAVIEFPTVYMIVPVILGAIGAFYGIGLKDGGEKLFVIVISVLYILISAITVFFGSKVFQLFAEPSDEE